MTAADFRARRLALEISINQLSQALGVSKQYISEIETRHYRVPDSLLRKAVPAMDHLAEAKMQALAKARAELAQLGDYLGREAEDA